MGSKFKINLSPAEPGDKMERCLNQLDTSLGALQFYFLLGTRTICFGVMTSNQKDLLPPGSPVHDIVAEMFSFKRTFEPEYIGGLELVSDKRPQYTITHEQKDILLDVYKGYENVIRQTSYYNLFPFLVVRGTPGRLYDKVKSVANACISNVKWNS